MLGGGPTAPGVDQPPFPPGPQIWGSYAASAFSLQAGGAGSPGGRGALSLLHQRRSRWARVRGRPGKFRCEVTQASEPEAPASRTAVSGNGRQCQEDPEQRPGCPALALGVVPTASASVLSKLSATKL